MRILLVTDSHLAPEASETNANWRAVRAFAERADASLTVHLGDITRDGWSAPAEILFAAELCEDWPMPMRFLPGNHDIGDNPPGPDHPYKQPLSLDLLAGYRAAFGPDYWSFDVAAQGEDWRLVGLNAQLFATGTAEEEAQWLWIEKALVGAGERPVVIFSHKPLFQETIEDEPPHIRYVPNAERRRLRRLIAQCDCRMFFSGHTHQFRQRSHGDTRHVWVPSTAYRFSDEMQEKVGEKIVGLGLLELGAEDAPGGVRFDLVSPQGMEQFERGLKG